MSTSLLRRLIAAGTPDDLVDEVAGLLADVRALELARQKNAARQARYKERQDQTGNVTNVSNVTDVSGDDTPAPAPTPSFPPDPPTNPAPTHTPVRPTRAGKGTRLPDDFEPKLVGQTAEMVKRWPPGRLEREVAQFRDHYAKTGGDKGLSRDWQASLRTWLRNADDRIPRQQLQRTGDRYGDRMRDPVLDALARGDSA